MGSFNTSCFVSRQTIASGDACLVVPLRQQSTYEPAKLSYRGVETSEYGVTSSTCYSSRFWRPVAGFLEAVYDDYGRVTLVDTKVNRFRLQEFLREALEQMPVVAEGSNTSHDLAFNLREFMAEEAPQLLAYLTAKRNEPLPEFDGDLFFSQGQGCFDHIQEVTQEQRTFWVDYKGTVRPFGLAVMHRAAYDALVARTNASVGWEGESFEMRAFFDRALATIKERLAELDAEPANGRDEASRQFTRRYFAFDRFRDYLGRVGGSQDSRPPQERAVLDALQEAYLDGKVTADQLFANLKPWLADRYACSSLEALNLHFEPMVYATQDYHNEVGEAYARLVAQIAAKVTRGRLDHYCGAKRDYSILVSDLAILVPLSKHARECDTYIEVAQTLPDSERPALTRVALECPLELDDLKEVLAGFLEDHDADTLLLDTLTEAPIQA